MEKRRLFLMWLLLFVSLWSNATVPTDTVSVTDSIYKNISLGEVAVRGHRPIIKNTGNQLTINIRGSYLSKMGSLRNMLSVTPGIVTKGEGFFEVVGRGKPIYYVDGREVASQDIFSTLQASNIAKIEIDREPSAQYPVGTVAVVNITTIKPLKDYVALDINGSISQRRKTSYSPPHASFRMKKGIWSTSVSYSYGVSKSLNKETYFKEIYYPDYTFRSDEATNLLMSSKSHTANWSNNLQLSKAHQLNFGYFFSHSEGNNFDDETLDYLENGTHRKKDVDRKRFKQRNLHDFSLAYRGVFGKNILNIGGDYVMAHDYNNLLTQEVGANSNSPTEISTINKGKFNILTLNASYSFALSGKVTARIGGRYYQTKHPLDYSTNNPALSALLSSNHQDMEDYVTAGYFILGKAWKKLTVDVYGRYEYSDTHIRVQTTSGDYEDGRYSSDFLPTLQVGYRFNKDWKLLAYYQKTVGRQGYLGLNPYPEYKDSLNYNIGNKELKPSYTDRISMYLTWKNLSLNIAYSDTKDDINQVAYCQDLSANVISSMPINTEHSRSWNFEIGYSQMLNRFSISSFVEMDIPNDEYSFLGKEYKTNKIGFDVNLNISFRFSDDCTIYSSFTYQSSNERFNRYQKMANNWSMGVQKSFFHDRLSLNLKVMDILHKAHYNNSNAKYINTQIGTYGTNDLRGVSLSCSYKMFNKNIKVKNSRSSNDIINRTL